MPTANDLFRDGRLDAAVDALGVELRQHPSDTQRRAFLFELLAFAGQYERAAKQLDVLASAGPMAEAGASVYRAALTAERIREHMFAEGDFPGAPAEPVAAEVNGQAVAAVEDADPRLGARLEVIAGGRYLWIPFEHLASITFEPPTQLRDLRWRKARLITGAAIRDMDLGEVLVPALSPSAWSLDDPELRLGRASDWAELPDGQFAPIGQKVWRVDGREVPMLQIHSVVRTTE